MLLKDLCSEYGENYSSLIQACNRGTLKGYKRDGRWHVHLNEYRSWRNKDRKKQCKTCKYRLDMGGYGWACDYLGITGHMRGCPTHPVCEKYEKKKDNRRRVKSPYGRELLVEYERE